MRSAIIAGMIAMASVAAAQTQLEPVWKITPSAQSGTITNSALSGSRGVGYNPATGNLLLATGSTVRKIRASDGADLGTLNVTGISGGTRILNKVVATPDGVIWGCNLDTGTTLKIYRWANEASAPTLVYEEAVHGGGTAGREGDDMDVIGTGTSAKVIVVGSGASTLSKFTYDGSVLTRTVVTPTTPAIGGSGQQVKWDPADNGSYYWMSTSNNNLYRYSSSDTGASVGNTGESARQPFDVTIDPNNASVYWFSTGCGAVAAGTSNPTSALRQITAGGSTLDPAKKFEYNYTALGSINGGTAVANASGGGDVIHDTANKAVYILYVDNSLTKFHDNSMLPVTVSGFSID